MDDDPGTREVLSRLLESRGAAVSPAATGHAALVMSLKEHFDVVVCDIGMPGMSGIDVIARLRSEPRTSTIKALALSAYADSDIRFLCTAAGFDDVATKPISRTELLEKISALLKGDKRTASAGK